MDSQVKSSICEAGAPHGGHGQQLQHHGLKQNNTNNSRINVTIELL